jgi:hypothetical protein
LCAVLLPGVIPNAERTAISGVRIAVNPKPILRAEGLAMTCRKKLAFLSFGRP